MEIVRTTNLNQNQKAGILKIWNSEYPDFLTFKTENEFDNYLNSLDNSEHLVVRENESQIGWLVKFDRSGQKWFVIMVSPNKQTKGIGTKLINLAKTNSTELNGWAIDKNIYRKANDELYISPLGFYEKMGFKITNEEFDKTKFSALKITWMQKSANNDD